MPKERSVLSLNCSPALETTAGIAGIRAARLVAGVGPLLPLSGRFVDLKNSTLPHILSKRFLLAPIFRGDSPRALARASEPQLLLTPQPLSVLRECRGGLGTIEEDG